MKAMGAEKGMDRHTPWLPSAERDAKDPELAAVQKFKVQLTAFEADFVKSWLIEQVHTFDFISSRMTVVNS